MKILMMLILTLNIGVATSQSKSELPLSELLTKQQLNSIGISKLSDIEKENLRVLLIESLMGGYDLGVEDGIKQATEYLAQDSYSLSGNTIESKIDGEFEGWEGETIVKLMNGQIWQQTEYYYHYHYAFMPDVLIFKSGSGFKMKVDGVDKSIGVFQLK